MSTFWDSGESLTLEAFEDAARRIRELNPGPHPVKIEMRPAEFDTMRRQFGMPTEGDLVAVSGLTFYGVPVHVEPDLPVRARAHMSDGTEVDLKG